MKRHAGWWTAAAALLVAADGGAAGAQVAQDANNYSLPPAPVTPAPSPTALPTIAPLPTPTASATPTAPPPAPGPTPTASPSAAPQPAPRAGTPAPRPSPTPSPSVIAPAPRTTPDAAPSAVPLPVPTPTPTPAPLAQPTPPPAADDTSGSIPWFWIAAGGAVVLALLAFAWLRRRRDLPDEPTYYDLGTPDDAPAPPAPPAPVTPRPAAPVSDEPRATIEVAIHPRRAGLNLLSATAEVEVALVNTGALAAHDVTVDVKLLGARAGHDELLARHFAEPIVRPVTARFALAPGEARGVRAVAALPRDAMEPLVAVGRPMFVPVVAVNVLYRWDAGEAGEGRGQSAAAWVVGITRDGTDKLAPFWLDVQPRMHEALGAREHGLAVRQ